MKQNKGAGKKLWREIIESIWENAKFHQGFIAKKEFICRSCGSKELCDTIGKEVCFNCRNEKRKKYGRKYGKEYYQVLKNKAKKQVNFIA